MSSKHPHRPLSNPVAWFALPSIVRHVLHTGRVTVLASFLALLLALFSAAAREAPSAAPDQPVADQAAADVSLIAAWLTGSDVAAGAVERPFGDAKWLTDAKDAICYTDVERVTLPRGLRRVPYDFLKPRMEVIRGGHKVSPAVLITRSVADDPQEGPLARRAQTVRNAKRDERYYYVEVAIGNLAWHWMKVVVYKADGKPKIEFLWSMVS